VKNISTRDGDVLITVKDASIHLQEILSRVGKVESVEVRPLTLEDVFLYYTGRAIREGSPEGGWAEKAMHAGRR
jgi:ABC-2 type transport system ATP-binding protein